VNPASGSHDPALATKLETVAAGHGATIIRTINFPDEPLPQPADLDAAGVVMLIVHTGDGTINAAAATLAGWGGALLVLPGGTLNLLAKRLHGDADAEAILDAALSGSDRTGPIPMIAGIDSATEIAALVGVFAGPTTAWGDVRETLRRRDLSALAEAVPRAFSQTFDGDQVRLDGASARYPAIYAEPVAAPDGPILRLMGFRADGAGELFRHGFAWLGGDFRNGPNEPLGEREEVVILCDGADMGLLVDGERGHEGTRLHLRAVDSPVAFVATQVDRPTEVAQ
jgi:diacylglycerol kinase family enzyme